MSTGSIESPIECDLPTERKAEVEGVSIWFRIHGLLERMQKLLTNRHSDRGPPDYEQDLSELRDLARRGMRAPQINISNDEGGDKKSWKDWILAIVGLLIVAWLGRLSLQMDDLIKVVAKQEIDEKRLDRLETRVFPGNP